MMCSAPSQRKVKNDYADPNNDSREMKVRRLLFKYNNHQLTSYEDNNKTFIEWDERQVSNLEVASISIDQLLKTIKRYRVAPTLVLLKNVVDSKTTSATLSALYILYCQLYTGTSYQLVMSLAEHASSISQLCGLAYSALTEPSNPEFLESMRNLNNNLQSAQGHVERIQKQSPDLGDLKTSTQPAVLEFIQQHDTVVKLVFGIMAMTATCFGISVCSNFAVFQSSLASLSIFAKSIRDGKVVGNMLDESTDAMLSALFMIAGSEYVPRKLQHVKHMAEEVNDLYTKVQAFKAEIAIDYFTSMRNDQFHVLHDAIVDLQRRFMTLTESEKSMANFKEMLSNIFQYLTALQEQRISLMRSQAGKQEPVCVYVAGAAGRGKTDLLNRLCISLYKSHNWTRYTRTFTDPFWSGYVGQAIYVGDDFNQTADGSDHFEFLQCKNSNSTDTIGAALEDKGKPFCSRVMLMSSNHAYVTSSAKITDMQAINRRRDLLVIAKNLSYSSYIATHPEAPPADWWAKNPTTFMVFDPLKGLTTRMTDLASADESHPFFVTNITEEQMIDFIVEKEKFFAEQYRKRIVSAGGEMADRLTTPITYDSEKFSVMCMKKRYAALKSIPIPPPMPPSSSPPEESETEEDDDGMSHLSFETVASDTTDESMKKKTLDWNDVVDAQLAEGSVRLDVPVMGDVSPSQPTILRSRICEINNEEFLRAIVNERIGKLPATHKMHQQFITDVADPYVFLKKLSDTMLEAVRNDCIQNLKHEILLSTAGVQCSHCKVNHGHRDCYLANLDFTVVEDVDWTALNEDPILLSQLDEIEKYRQHHTPKHAATVKSHASDSSTGKKNRGSETIVPADSSGFVTVDRRKSKSAHAARVVKQAKQTFPVVSKVLNPKRYAIGLLGPPGVGKTHAVRRLLDKGALYFDWDEGCYTKAEGDELPVVIFDDITVSEERMTEFKEILSIYHEDEHEIQMMYFTANQDSPLWTAFEQEMIGRRSMMWQVTPSWSQSMLYTAKRQSFSNFLIGQSDEYRNTNVMMKFHSCANRQALKEFDESVNYTNINFLAFEAILNRSFRQGTAGRDKMMTYEAFTIPDFDHEVYVRFSQSITEVPKQDLSSLSGLDVYERRDNKHRKISVWEFAKFGPLLLKLLASSAFGTGEEFVTIFNQEMHEGSIPRVRVDFKDCTVAFMSVEDGNKSILVCALVEDHAIPVVIQDSEVVIGGVSHEITPENVLYANALKVALNTNEWLPDMKIDTSDAAIFAQTTRSNLYNLIRIVANLIEFAVMGVSLVTLMMPSNKDPIVKESAPLEASTVASDQSPGFGSPKPPTAKIDLGDHPSVRFYNRPNQTWANDEWKSVRKDWNTYTPEPSLDNEPWREARTAPNLSQSAEPVTELIGKEWCVRMHKIPMVDGFEIDGNVFCDPAKKLIVLRVGHAREMIPFVAKYDIKVLHSVQTGFATLKGMEHVSVIVHPVRALETVPETIKEEAALVKDNELMSKGDLVGISFRDRVIFARPIENGFVVDCETQEGWKKDEYPGDVDQRCLQVQIGNIIVCDYVHFPKIFALFFLTNSTKINGFDYADILRPIFSSSRPSPLLSNLGDRSVRIEGNVDAMIMQEIKFVENNRVDLLVDGKVYVHGIMLKGRIGLTVQHAVGKSNTVRTYQYGRDVSIRWINEWPKRDLAVFEIVESVPEFRNIISHFVTAQDLTTIMGTGLTDIPMVLSMVDCVERSHYLTYGCVDAVVKSSDVGGSYHAKLNSYMSTGITEMGSCGSLTAFVTPSANRKFFGMHNAGSQLSSYFTFLTQERIHEILSIMPEAPVVNTRAMRVPQGALMYKNPFNLSNGAFVVGQIVDKVHIPDKTSLYRTGIVIPEFDTTEPSVLSQHDSRVPGRSLYVEAVDRYFTPGTKLSPEQKEELRLCYKIVGASVVSKLIRKNKKVRVLTKSEALNGVPSAEFENLKSMDCTGSVGWPYNKLDPLHRGQKREFLTTIDGKKTFSQDKMSQKISSDIDLMIADAKRGTKTLVPFVPYGKDEARDASKTNGPKAKTRVFFACNMSFLVAFRQYFQAAQCRMMEIRHEIAPKIGIAANERSDWTTLHVNIERNAGFGIDMDAENWDSTMMQLELHWVNKYFFEPIYKALDDNWTPEDARVRKLLHEVGEGAYVIVFGRIIKLDGKMISGFPNTPFGNSLALWCEMFYIWRLLARENNFDPSFTAFEANVFVVIYGDDNTLSIKPEVCPWFTFKNIQRIGMTLGTKFSPAEKDKPDALLVPLTKLTFLKRHFKEVGDQKMGCLDLASIMKPIHWVKSNPAYDFTDGVRECVDKRVIASSLNVICYELALHGKETFTRFVTDILRQCGRKGIPFDPPAWEEAIELLGYRPV